MDKTNNSNDNMRDDRKERSARALSFTRRALLEMGWTIPAAVAIAPAAFAAHVDQHEDETHADNRHLDTKHFDEPLVDTAHNDMPHVDTRHGDERHLDGVAKLHNDFSDNGRHGDRHFDTHNDRPHTDIAHVDDRHADNPHSDRPHLDVPHNDQPHLDRPHFDSHGDRAN